MRDDQKLIIDYEMLYGFGGFSIKIFENGNYSSNAGILDSGDKNLSKPQIEEIIKKFEEAEFFDMDVECLPSYVCDGWSDSLTINYRGRQNTVKRDNDIRSFLYDEAIKYLKDMTKP